jgi:hypothetical protein
VCLVLVDPDLVWAERCNVNQMKIKTQTNGIIVTTTLFTKSPTDERNNLIIMNIPQIL